MTARRLRLLAPLLAAAQGARWRMTARRALALLLASASPALAAESITVVSWGGSYQRASEAAVMRPFTEETGIEVVVDTYSGDLAQARAQVEIGDVYWDVVDLDFDDFVRGCDEGLLEPMPVAALPPAADGTPAASDYLPGAIIECGPATLYASAIYAYNRESFPNERPSKIADFFDLKRFPGRRGLRRAAEANLEMALLADGVPRAEIYALLSTPEGMKRAFRKLDVIKEEIVWWEAGAQPPQLLADREVVMTNAYNGRIFNAQVLENQPFEVVWDGAVTYPGGFGIVAGTRNLEAARKFIAFAARPEVMAALSKYISYSPARRSARPLVTTHLATGIEMAPHMPTSDEHLAHALMQDPQWWSDYGDEANERFAAWLTQ